MLPDPNPDSIMILSFKDDDPAFKVFDGTHE